MSISRRRFLGTAVASGLAANAVPAAEPGKRYNLLWLMTDQQPVSTLGAYGNPTIRTPHLDRIANEGVRFDQFHISAFPCSPSRACFLTGREAHNHGVVKNDVPLEEDVPALGDVLKAAGYNTGYVGKWHLSGSMYRDLPGAKPFDGCWYYRRVPDETGYRFEKARGGTGEDAPQHGFDFWRGGWADYRDYLRESGLGHVLEENPRVGNHNDWPSGPDWTHSYSRLGEDHHMAAYFAQEAAAFLDAQRGSEAPFGLVVSFYGPHLPVAPPRPWDEMYSLDDVALPANHHDLLDGKPLGQKRNGRCYALDDWTGEQFLDYIRRYWGYCSYIDHHIGRVLEALDRSGKADDTIVLFTSDHGDMVAAHGFVYKLTWCGYDELLRVPFLLRCPGRIEPGSAYTHLAESVDVLPSLLELMDIPAPDRVDGCSFVAPVRKSEEYRDDVVCNSMEINLTAVTPDWKYVLNWRRRDLDELYDRVNDPGEMHNLAYDETHAETVAAMQQRVVDWLEETGHPYKDVIITAIHEEPPHPLDLRPEVVSFKHLGGGVIEYSYHWHVGDALPDDEKYWSFTQFCHPKHGKDGDIVFRDTTWPDPPTTQWKAGDTRTVGPVRVQIPKETPAAAYSVRIGLYNPDSRSGPGALADGANNYVMVGDITVRKEAGEVTEVVWKPRENR